ncbi:MAG TPA: disulfide reductase, partial [Thermodesulfovibrionales bacterium]|nr:disulfide reductase [Thermodesulfovibrionales bacterium]
MKAGIFICECGPNIRDAIDINDIVTFARGLDHVVFTTSFNLLCSEEGQNLIERYIREHNLSHVIIAACTPKEHENTFRKVLSKAGLNPFLLQVVNIREQCAWVVKDRVLVTQKAKAMIAAAVRRVALHEPLEVKEIQCESDALVVGAGIAGMS